MIILTMSGDLPISSVIKHQRERAHLTQKDLGHIIGVSASCVNRWEQGNRAPSLNTFRKILTVTGAEIQIIAR